MFLHRPEMSKPKLGKATAEPYSLLLDEVRFTEIGRKSLIRGRIDTIGRRRGD